MLTSPLFIMAFGAAHLERTSRFSNPLQSGIYQQTFVSDAVGGAAFRASLAMRLFGTRVAFCTARGGDAAGESVSEAIERAGIDGQAFVWLDRASAIDETFLDDNGKLVSRSEQVAIYDLLGKRGLRQRRVRDRLAHADALVLDAHLSVETIDYVVDRFGDRPIAAIGVSPINALRLSSSLRRFSALFLARSEAAALTMLPQTTSVAELAYCLDQMGARRAIVTDGSTDAAILEDGVVCLQAPPSNTPAYRQTGAGDLLAGAAFRAFVAGHSFERSARLGMATACHLIDVNGLTESTLDAIAATEHAMVRSRTIAKT